MHVGIDYGSKLAGTTVVAFAQNGSIRLLQSEKKKDADQFILDFVLNNPLVDRLYIDAPLSLPQSLIHGTGNNYHYRECDKALNAMSPMFLGGLTARAIQLRHQLAEQATCFEVYPGGLIRQNALLKANYAKKKSDKIPSFMEDLSALYPLPIYNEVRNWHQVDAILAWWIGWKHLRKEHKTYGDEKEGVIFI
jgi:predicted nuclease with RNAse H fold